jgi:hypothetical protein
MGLIFPSPPEVAIFIRFFSSSLEEREGKGVSLSQDGKRPVNEGRDE